jgi:hypothetical protein
MAQYKSFAPKGSFSDFQITAPDQSQQIEKETARQLRGRQAAQNFKEKNDEIYLSALKLKFSEEQAQRDENFEAQIKSKKVHHEQERLNYQNQIQGEAIKAQQKLKGFKDLAEFSKTAFQTYAQIDETLKKNERAALHQIALDAGLDFEDLQSIRGINQKLTRSQFNQIEFIQRKIEDGASDAQINALYKAFEKSGSSQWFNVTALYQNSALSHSAYIDQGLRDFFESFEGKEEQPSIEQINAKAKSLNAEFIEAKFAGARPEVLESSGIYKEIRSNTRTILRGYHTANSKEQAIKLKNARFKTLANVYKTDRMAGIHREITTNPSARSRVETLEWVENAVKTGVITPDKALDLITNKFDQDQSLLERFPGRPEVVSLVETVELQRKRANANYRERVEFENAEKAAAAFKALNDELESTGGISEEAFRAQEEFLIQNGVNPNVIKNFEHYSNDAQASRIVDSQWEARFEKSGTLPTLEEINNFSKLDATTRNKWIQLLNQRKQIEPQVKEHEKSIRDQVKAAPQIQALGSATPSGTVAIMQTRMVQEFRRLLKTTDPDAARAIVIEKIQKLQADPSAFDAKGNYTSIMNELATDSARGKVDAAALNDTIDVIKNTPTTRRDFKKLSTAMGASVVYGDLGNLMNGRATSALFNNVANKLNMSPYELAETLDKAGNLGIIEGPQASEWDKIIRQTAESNKGKRLRNTHREVVERTYRANTLDNRSGQTAPVRGSDLSKFRAAIINKESGGNYTIVNPDSGAIGIGQVMPYNVRPWTQKYLGRILTPEEFRYNPGAQDAVVNGRFKDMLADQRAAGYTGELMIRRAASVWYSGKPDLWNNTRPQWSNGVQYPSIAEYTQSIWNTFQSSN